MLALRYCNFLHTKRLTIHVLSHTVWTNCLPKNLFLWYLKSRPEVWLHNNWLCESAEAVFKDLRIKMHSKLNGMFVNFALSKDWISFSCLQVEGRGIHAIDEVYVDADVFRSSGHQRHLDETTDTATVQIRKSFDKVEVLQTRFFPSAYAFSIMEPSSIFVWKRVKPMYFIFLNHSPDFSPPLSQYILHFTHFPNFLFLNHSHQ